MESNTLDRLSMLKSAWQLVTEQDGFDAHFRNLELLSASDGEVLVRVEVTPNLQNMLGKLHGGAVATLVDNVGTLAVLATQDLFRPGVTTDLHVSFYRPAEGMLVVAGKVLKLGKTLVFVEVELRGEADTEVLAKGQMTKYLV